MTNIKVTIEIFDFEINDADATVESLRSDLEGELDIMLGNGPTYSIDMDVVRWTPWPPYEISVANIRAGMVLGSGFRVTRDPQRGLRTESGKVEVGGYYPGSAEKMYTWNRQTKVTVVSE